MSASTNQAQIEHWNGEAGAHWAAAQARFDTMLRPFGDRVIAGAALQPGEAVLDIGCGNGTTVLAAATAVGPGGRVLGVDLSAAMLDRARERAAEAGLGNATFVQADAQSHGFAPASHDVAISRFGVMFFDDPVAAFTNVATALRPGGRLAFVCWQALAVNDWMSLPIRAALEHVPAPPPAPPGAPGPFSLGDGDRVRAVLGAAGFTDVALEAVLQPVLVGGGGTLDETVAFFEDGSFCRQLLDGVDQPTADRALASVREAYAAHLGDDGVRLPGAAWLVTARR